MTPPRSRLVRAAVQCAVRGDGLISTLTQGKARRQGKAQTRPHKKRYGETFFFLKTQAGDVTARVLGCYVKLVQLSTTLP